MNEGISKKLAELMGKMDDRVTQAKVNAALDMLQKGDTKELAKKINKVDKEDLLSKINEFDVSKLKNMNINIDEVKQKINEADLKKLSALLGEHGDEIIDKIKDMIK